MRLRRSGAVECAPPPLGAERPPYQELRAPQSERSLATSELNSSIASTELM